MMKEQKSWLMIGIIVIVLLFLGVAGFFAYQNYQFKQPFPAPPTLSDKIETETKEKVLIGPAGDVKVTIPGDVYPEYLKFELSETLVPANIPGYKSFHTVGLWAFTTDNQPVTELKNEVTIELTIPETFDSLDKTKNEWWTYLIEKPMLFRLDKNTQKWELVSSDWKQDFRILRTQTSQIGSLAVVVPDSSVKFLKKTED